MIEKMCKPTCDRTKGIVTSFSTMTAGDISVEFLKISEG